MFSLHRHPCAYRLTPLPDPSLLIPPGFFPQVQVQSLPVGHLWHRHHVIPAKVSPFSFHSALLVPFSGGAELRLEAPMRSEGDESCRLLPLVTPQNLLHRTLQVVIPKSFENSHEIGKPQFVRFQKRLLAAVREGAMERSSTGHAAHAKYVRLLSLSPNIGVRFIPVHLRFLPPSVGLRNESLVLDQSQLNLPLANIATNRGLGDANCWKFLADSRPDPMCRVALLSGRLLVRLQDGFDEGLRRFQSWLASPADLSLSRNGIP